MSRETQRLAVLILAERQAAGHRQDVDAAILEAQTTPYGDLESYVLAVIDGRIAVDRPAVAKAITDLAVNGDTGYQLVMAGLDRPLHLPKLVLARNDDGDLQTIPTLQATVSELRFHTRSELRKALGNATKWENIDANAALLEGAASSPNMRVADAMAQLAALNASEAARLESADGGA